MSVTANIPLFAKTASTRVFADSSTKSEMIPYATDTKGQSRAWQANDPIGNATGILVSNSEGVWVEVKTRAWVRQKLSKNTPKGVWFIPGLNIAAAAITSVAEEWIRVEKNAYVKEGDFFTNETRVENEYAVIERKVAQDAAVLETKYRPTKIFKDDDGVWSVQLPNGYVTSVTKYGQLSLAERKNIALSIEAAPMGKAEITKQPELTTTIPTWAKAVLLVLGVAVVGIGGYQLLKKL
ncbi:hypothetical protein [Runella limosa]|uniref:hypothetical protein n=1 Tax=Runella limosa TaxID=370978 RepID=UPI0004237D20|nr:hypothetical protein [Runella limosa]